MSAFSDIATTGRVFWVAEVGTFRPASGVDTEEEIAWASFPFSSTVLGPEIIQELADKIRASDIGFIPAGVGEEDPIYPAILDRSIVLDRGIDPDPQSRQAGRAWGELRLLNYEGEFDYLAEGIDTDSRETTIFLGSKEWDPERQIHLDPTIESLRLAYSGLAGTREFDENGVIIPLNDVSYYLEQPMQAQRYEGWGGREGTPELEGQPKPRLRGGTSTHPVRNVTPVLVDPVNLVYQVSDGPGTIEMVYQRGLGGDIAFQGVVNDLYSGTTNPGSYRVESSENGLFFQLGSIPEGEITVDATGYFRTAGHKRYVGEICLQMLLDDLGVDEELVYTDAWLQLDVDYGYEMGIYLGPDERKASEVLGDIMAGVGGRLMTGRAGRLRPYMFNPPEDLEQEASYDETQIISATPVQIPPSVTPAVWRVRVGHSRNYTVQTSDLADAVDGTRRQFLADEWRYGQWVETTSLARYRRPGDITVPSHLTRRQDAVHVAERLGAIWGITRQIFDIEMWLQPLQHDLGEAVVTRYPVAGLRDGAICMIIGEQIRSAESTVIMRVLR